MLQTRYLEMSGSGNQAGQLRAQLKNSQAEHMLYKTYKEAQLTRLIHDNQHLQACQEVLRARIGELEVYLRFYAQNVVYNGYFQAWENVKENTKELQCELMFDAENRALRAEVLRLKAQVCDLRYELELAHEHVQDAQRDIGGCAEFCSQLLAQQLASDIAAQTALDADFCTAHRAFLAEEKNGTLKVSLAMRALRAHAEAVGRELVRVINYHSAEFDALNAQIRSGQVYKESADFIYYYMKNAPPGVSFGRFVEVQSRRNSDLQRDQAQEIARLEESNRELLAYLEAGDNIKTILETNFVFRDFIDKLQPGESVIDALAQHILSVSAETDEILQYKDALAAKHHSVAQALNAATYQYEDTLDKLTALQIEHQRQQYQLQHALDEYARQAKHQVTELENQVQILSTQYESREKALLQEMQSSLFLSEQRYQNQQELLESTRKQAQAQCHEAQQQCKVESEQLRARLATLSAQLAQYQSLIAQQQVQMLQQSATSEHYQQYMQQRIASGYIYDQANVYAQEFVSKLMEGRSEPFIDVVQEVFAKHNTELMVLRYQIETLKLNGKSVGTEQVFAMNLLQQMIKAPEFADFIAQFDGSADDIMQKLAKYVATLKARAQQTASLIAPYISQIYICRDIAPLLHFYSADTAAQELKAYITNLKTENDGLNAKLLQTQTGTANSAASSDEKYAQLKQKYRGLDKYYEELKAYTVRKKQQCAEYQEKIGVTAKELSAAQALIKKMRQQFSEAYIAQLIRNRPQNITHAVLQYLLDEELKSLNEVQLYRSDSADQQAAADYVYKRRILIYNAASALSHLTYFAMTVDRKQNKKYEDAGVLELFVAVCQLSDNKELLGMRICGSRQLVDQMGKQLKFMYESRQDAGEEIFSIIKWAYKISEYVGR